MIARVSKALNRKDGDKGFTLIELLVVIIIIGILAAIAVPQFIKQREKGFDAAVKSDLKNISLVAETNYTDTLSYATTASAFLQGGAGGTNIASKGTSYKAWSDADSYVVYGLSKSGKVFKIDSDTTNTPEPAGSVTWSTLAAPTGYTGTATSWSGPA